MATNLVRVKNEDKKGPNDADYHYHVRLSFAGERVNLAFTDHQLWVAYRRACKNSNEIPKAKNVFGRIIDAAF